VVSLVCETCGAPLAAESADRVVTCAFCGASAAPVPKVVERVVERVLVVTASGAAETARLHCPRCGEGLRDVRARDRVLSMCPGCGGAWVDAATVEHLRKVNDEEIVRAAHRGIGVIMRGVVSQRPRISCPVCQAALRRTAVGEGEDGGGIVLDVDSCAEHGTWFDPSELASFVRTHTDLRAGDVSDDDLASAGVKRGWF
jgi:Zn-finger nucleic acid-binding protein